jgi:oligopeptide transport system permease protein
MAGLTPASAETADLLEHAARSPGAEAWMRFRAHKSAYASLYIIAGLVLFACLAPIFLPHGYDQVVWTEIRKTPDLSNFHPFGTDSVGRDVMVRSAIGLLVSFALALLATIVSLGVGVVYGATAGFVGGRTDNLMMRFVDVMYSLPFMFLVIVLTVVFGRHIWLIFIGVGLVEWLTMARIVRGQTLSLKQKEFITAARALGASRTHILRRHILPNLIGIVIVYATLTLPQVILVESFLSFLGLGVQEPLTSLGVLIKEGADELEDGIWLLLAPGVLLMLLLVALNLIGDGLRDAFDPKER